MTERSWTEIQSLGVRAASGAGVPAAQALAFGAMLARHLADGGAEAPLAEALRAPKSIVALSHQIETMVETASVGARAVTTRQEDAGRRALLVSWLTSLPCRAIVTAKGADVQARLSLTDPGTRARPARVAISAALYDQLQDLAARTYVPDSAASRASGAGAGLMELE